MHSRTIASALIVSLAVPCGAFAAPPAEPAAARAFSLGSARVSALDLPAGVRSSLQGETREEWQRRYNRMRSLRNAGIAMTLSGVALTVAGIAYGVSQENAYDDCWNSAASRGDYRAAESCENHSGAGALVAGGGIVLSAAGVPLWIVGAVKAGRIQTERQALASSPRIMLRRGDHQAFTLQLGRRNAVGYALLW
jgi:hypothetical protein